MRSKFELIVAILTSLYLSFDSRRSFVVSQTCGLTCNYPNDDVCRLDCSRRDLREIAGEMRITANVESIAFNENKIEHLRRNIFPAVNRVAAVDFSHNAIDYIADGTFRTLNYTRTLLLAHNALWNIENDIFDGLSSLDVLDLSFNRLTDWDSNVFAPLTSLTRLNLAHNTITSLSANSFAHLPSLVRLELDYNELSSIVEDQFESNVALRYLSLKGNRFKNVPTPGLQSTRNLLQLDLSGNYFARIARDDFAGLSTIETLRLNRMSTLVAIDAFAFETMFNLKVFECNNNDRLRSIDDRAFLNYTSNAPMRLNAFYLRNAAVTYLAADLLAWNATKAVDLSGNPWYCDCKLRWIRDLTIGNETRSDWKCDRPSRHAGVKIFAIAANDFTCNLLDRVDYEVVGICSLIVVICMVFTIAVYVCVRLSLCSKIFNRKKSAGNYVRVRHKKDRIDLEWDYEE